MAVPLSKRPAASGPKRLPAVRQDQVQQSALAERGSAASGRQQARQEESVVLEESAEPQPAVESAEPQPPVVQEQRKE